MGYAYSTSYLSINIYHPLLYLNSCYVKRTYFRTNDKKAMIRDEQKEIPKARLPYERGNLLLTHCLYKWLL